MDKIIWMLWIQGLDHAPFLVQKCVESWKKFHPDWRIVFLDQENLHEYVNVEHVIAKNRMYLTHQSYANIIRVNLLRKYGGVWVDATCYCQIPLDTWLPEVMTSGFFAFRNPGPDRIMSNWFMASEQNCYLVHKLCDEIHAYWQSNRFSGMKKALYQRLRRHLMSYTSKNSYRGHLWFNPLVLKLLKVYPLFWFHYLFARLVHRDAEFKKIWNATPDRPADPVHAVQFFGQLRELDEAMRRRIESHRDPLYKLTWKKIPQEGIVPNSVLDFLLNASRVSGK